MTVTGGDQPHTVTLPFAEDRSPREAFIRDLYALAAFYVAHPDHPLPWSISLHHHVDTDAELDRITDEFRLFSISGKPAQDRPDGARQFTHGMPSTRTDICLYVVRPAGR